ncbi:MAG: hypothetical protein ACRC2T_11035 [Thermoguttaceae bacterium]
MACVQSRPKNIRFRVLADFQEKTESLYKFAAIKVNHYQDCICEFRHPEPESAAK